MSVSTDAPRTAGHRWTLPPDLPRLARSALLLLALSCGGGGDAQRPNVLLITVDTLRADGLAPYGAPLALTPHAGRLAAEGTLFEAATSPMQITRPSHFSIFTSRYPREHGVVNNELALPPELPTVAEAFREAGYATAAFVGVRLLDRASGAARGFEVYEAPGPERRRRGDRVVEQALGWMERPARAPFFVWVHLFDPHLPYAPPEPFAPPAPPALMQQLPVADWPRLARVAREHDGDVPSEIAQRARALYAAEVEYADHQLGALLAGLERSGRLDRTIVLLTADHGECFEQGIHFEHKGCLFEGASRVPLVVRYPASVPAGERRGEVVELLDVAPTLLALAGLPAPPEFLGRRLFDASDPARGAAFLQHPLESQRTRERASRLQREIRSVGGQPTRFDQGDVEWVGVRTREWKYLRSAGREELYRLDPDPSEGRNLAGTQPGVTAELRARLDAWLRAHPPRAIEQTDLDPEQVETLRALGYVE